MQKSLHIFDPAMCCSSGVCGTEIDPQLLSFSADVDWAKNNGAHIERFNLAQQPMDFANNKVVRDFLERSGQDALPLTLLDGEFALAGRYPNRAELARWTGIAAQADIQPASCCSGSKCC
jgi:hypothetical protein